MFLGLKIRAEHKLLTALGGLLLCAAPSLAFTPQNNDTALGKALASQNNKVLLAREEPYGFSLSGGSYNGRSSGMTIEAPRGTSGLGLLTNSRDKFAELEGDQRLYALLIDGKYDFDYDLGTGLPLHPYLGVGVGVALYESGNRNLQQQGALVPLFRFGGGVVFKLGADWDLSLNYKTGYSGNAPGSGFTNRNQETVNLQALDMGLKLKF